MPWREQVGAFRGSEPAERTQGREGCCSGRTWLDAAPHRREEVLGRDTDLSRLPQIIAVSRPATPSSVILHIPVCRRSVLLCPCPFPVPMSRPLGLIPGIKSFRLGRTLSAETPYAHLFEFTGRSHFPTLACWPLRVSAYVPDTGEVKCLCHLPGPRQTQVPWCVFSENKDLLLWNCSLEHRVRFRELVAASYDCLVSCARACLALRSHFSSAGAGAGEDPAEPLAVRGLQRLHLEEFLSSFTVGGVHV